MYNVEVNILVEVLFLFLYCLFVSIRGKCLPKFYVLAESIVTRLVSYLATFCSWYVTVTTKSGNKLIYRKERMENLKKYCTS